MKSLSFLPVPVKFWPVFIIYLTLTFSVVAQNVQYRDPLQPSKGHWLLLTDAATRTTTIKFFDGQNNLLYEEAIPGKYIKLTNRNINRINQTFDLVTRNDLILSKVKANLLISLASNPSSQIRNTKYASQANAGANIKLNTFKIPNTAKFHLAFHNPDRERIKIYVINNTKQVIYDENLNSAAYNRRYDFTGLHPGKYTLVLTTVNRKFRYTEEIIMGPTNQSWQPEKPVPALITSTE